MTEEEKKEAQTEEQPKKKKKKDPVEQALERTEELRTTLKALENETITLDGKLKNRNPALAKQIANENEIMKKRIENMNKAYQAILLEGLQVTEKQFLEFHYEDLKQATIEYCKKANVDLKIWKELAS